ncbi:hypothetical protein [Actinoplanes sp. NPDC051411]|uniref:hypothetical protein n=1 Tax=Actinoplanes sp. NPDC051411 TaxID=3155522 RepID=UPI003426742A
MRLWIDASVRRVDDVEARPDGTLSRASRLERQAVAGVVTEAGEGRATTGDLDRASLRAAVRRAADAVLPGPPRPEPPVMTAEVDTFADPRGWTPEQIAELVETVRRDLAGAVPGGRWVVRARAIREHRMLGDSRGLRVREEITRCWLHARAVTAAGAAAVDGQFARHPADLRPAELAEALLTALPEGPFCQVDPTPVAIVWAPAATARLLGLITALPAAERAACLATAPAAVLDDPRHPTGPRSAVFDPDGFVTADRASPLARTAGPASNVVLDRFGTAAADGLLMADLLDARLGRDGADRVIRAAFLGAQGGGTRRPVHGVLAVPVADLLGRSVAALGPGKFLHGLGGFDAATLITLPGPRLRIRDDHALSGEDTAR